MDEDYEYSFMYPYDTVDFYKIYINTFDNSIYQNDAEGNDIFYKMLYTDKDFLSFWEVTQSKEKKIQHIKRLLKHFENTEEYEKCIFCKEIETLLI